MAHCWTVDPVYRDSEVGALFHTLDDAMNVTGVQISQDPRCRVFRMQHSGRTFYLKKFHRNGKLWRHRYSPSRVKTEWQSLQYFREWGIPVPPLVAYGHERHLGRFVRGMLVTEAVYGAHDLEALARQGDKVVKDWAVFRRLADKIARYTRIMHSHHFAHNDLDWRNILVVSGEDPQVYFFDAPCGRFWFGPFLKFRIFKDLAHLDEVAREMIPPRWRLYFYKRYTGRRKLTPEDKVLIRRIMRYYDNR